MMRWFYTDDHTGKYSDTTVRAWILFFLFVVYMVILACAMTLSFFFPELFASPAKIDGALQLGELLFYAFMGVGGLYLGKRVNEAVLRGKRSGYRNTDTGRFSDRSRRDREEGSMFPEER